MTSARRPSWRSRTCSAIRAGELLGAQGLIEDDPVDRLVDDLLEARHVDAGLLRVEVDEALELGEVEAAVARRPVAAGSGGDVDHLLDARGPRPGSG